MACDYSERVRLALDEQIFAIQAFGGISRMHAEIARQFVTQPELGVEVLPLSAPIINRYVLDDPELSQALRVKKATNEWTALGRYFTRLKVHPRAEIIHNTFYLPHGLAPTRGAKRIVTVHDMIPEFMPQTRRRLDLLTLKERYVHRADHIICVSQATKSDLLRMYPKIEAPITVVHHGVDPLFTPDSAPLSDLPQDYILYIGNRGQYKDANVLFTAFAQIYKEFPNLHLICIGGGPFTKEENARFVELGIVGRVRQDVLSDQRMSAAYANSKAFVFPSRYEGFGLPALESMASGAPTILANSTSLPEVGGDGAIYFEVGDPIDLSEKLRLVLSDSALRSSLVERGITRAAEFTWLRSAQETANVYRVELGATIESP
jgi:glycosyltransferase involved in cell wall biosynthesis